MKYFWGTLSIIWFLLVFLELAGLLIIGLDSNTWEELTADPPIAIVVAIVYIAILTAQLGFGTLFAVLARKHKIVICPNGHGTTVNDKQKFCGACGIKLVTIEH